MLANGVAACVNNQARGQVEVDGGAHDPFDEFARTTLNALQR